MATDAEILEAAAKNAEYIQRLEVEIDKAKDALAAAKQLMDWAESKCHTNCTQGYVPMMPHGNPEPCQWCITRTLIEQALKEVEL